MKAIVILISGRGSNMQALIEAALPVEIRGVISNRVDAAGLAIARARGIATRVVEHKRFDHRDEFDRELATQIDSFGADYVVLAGFMRMLGDAFVGRYPRRILNIHPSLLPAFPGLHTHERALESGVKIHGCTVHFVTAALDHGPIVVQAAIPVFADDTPATLAARVLDEEHRIYPRALRWIAEDRVEFLPGDIVRIRDSAHEVQRLSVPRD